MDGELVCKWRPAQRKADVYAPEDASISWAIYFEAMLKRGQYEYAGGGSLHASSLKLKNGCALCVGPSGVGKTTLYNLASPQNRIADEISDVLPRDDGWSVVDDMNWIHPVRAILFPARARRANTNELIESNRTQTLVRLMQNKYCGLWHERDSESALRSCEKLSSQVRAFDFHFEKNRAVYGFLSRELTDEHL
jgi:hypothetical protein